jgi:5-methylcytosine-specific restriction enzyme A
MPTKPKTFEGERYKRFQLQDNRLRNRTEEHRKFYTSDWRRLAKFVLTKQPVCAGYGDSRGICNQPAVECDHIQSAVKRPDLFLVLENLQGLCKACHTRKTRDGL